MPSVVVLCVSDEYQAKLCHPAQCGCVVCQMNTKLKLSAQCGYVVCQMNTKLKLSAQCPPEEAVRLLLEKRANKSGESQANHDHYVLKVFGLDEFLYGSYPLIQFKVGTSFHRLAVAFDCYKKV